MLLNVLEFRMPILVMFLHIVCPHWRLTHSTMCKMIRAMVSCWVLWCFAPLYFVLAVAGHLKYYFPLPFVPSTSMFWQQLPPQNPQHDDSNDPCLIWTPMCVLIWTRSTCFLHLWHFTKFAAFFDDVDCAAWGWGWGTLDWVVSFRTVRATS